MFATTFMGHQGWLFQTDKAALLVDTLLCESFGETHALEYTVFPPRVLVPAQFPKLDAVILTHEHDDHFDIPSLAKLDRAIPIYLSVRSSVAARQILAEMGFTVHPLVPGVPVRFADLELLPFTGDHVTTNCGDEWDTLPFLVRSTDGHGSFFSMVDIPITQGHVEWAAARAMRPGIVSWTNNALDWSHMADYLAERVEATQQCFVNMGVGHKLIETVWGTPAAMVMCAGGFTFTGDKAWLNDRVFCVDTDAVCAQMGKVYKKEKFYAGVPGQTFRLVANKLRSVDDTAPFLTTAPRDTWPARGRGSREIRDYAPATTRALTAAQRTELLAQLDAFAGALVGGTVFRSLCSLLASEHEGRRATFALVLRTEAEPLLFEYDPTACRFIPGVADRAQVLAGLECWAADLHAVLAGQLGPIALTFGRSSLWNALPKRLNFAIFEELHRVSHPLRLPAAYLATYQRIWHQHRDVRPSIGRP